MQRKELLRLAAIFGAIVLMAGLLFVTKKETFHGTVISPPLPPKPITLTDHNGDPFSLEDLRGKVVVIYFGYTNCPEECPLAMAQMKQVLEILGDKSSEIQVLLISTDPARDDGPSLAKFLAYFDPTFLGLTGTPEQLAKVWVDYGVIVMDNGETHSDRFYILDRSGNFALTFLADMLADDMASDLRLLLKQ